MVGPGWFIIVASPTKSRSTGSFLDFMHGIEVGSPVNRYSSRISYDTQIIVPEEHGDKKVEWYEEIE